MAFKSRSVQMPEEVWEFLEKAAKDKNESVSALVRHYITYNIRNIIIDNVEKTKIEAINNISWGFVDALRCYLVTHNLLTIETPVVCPEDARKKIMHYFSDNPEIFKNALSNIKFMAHYQDDVQLVRLWSDKVESIEEHKKWFNSFPEANLEI